MSINTILQVGALALAALPALATACNPRPDATRDAARQTAAPEPLRAPAVGHGGDSAAVHVATPAGEHEAPILGTATGASSLERARGGQAGMAGTATLDGMVSGNSATNVVTGANSIQASSFAGANGIPIVIQNTGANVLIQNATVINLQFK